MIQLFNEDCRETLKRIPDGSIDLLLQDTPFGVTQNDWDIAPNFAEMWPEWERVTKENAAIIFFGTQPFASELILSRSGLFKYDLIWEKSIATGFLNANKMPLRGHESILIFYRKLPTYNPQKIFLKTPSFKKGNKARGSENYGNFNHEMDIGSKDGSRFPRSILNVSYEECFFDATKKNQMIHPTQKPINIMRYLILTYSNKGDTVFDGYSGSGSTAVACKMEGRNFIGSELNREYYEKSMQRIALLQPQLF